MISLFRGFLGAAFFVIAGLSQASAASITEEFSVFYTNTSSSSFTLTNLFFGISGGTNLIPAGDTNPGSLGTGNHVTLFSEQLVLDTSPLYTFSGISGGTPFSAGINVPESKGTITFATDGIVVVAESMSPVPLPASFPLFALAMICLGAWTFFSGKKKQQDLPDTMACVSVQSG